LSYLGTYAADRQAGVEDFLVEPARQLPNRAFIIGGAQYPQDFPWTQNTKFVRHLPPAQHPQFYCSSRLTLNVTRKAMMEMGYCPSGRLFEAAACGTPILSDLFEGLDDFYQPGSEILIARTTADATAAIELSDAELSRVSRAALERTMAEHTAERRAIDFERIVEAAVGHNATSSPLAG
jgi:spore maturation protein CgeB